MKGEGAVNKVEFHIKGRDFRHVHPSVLNIRVGGFFFCHREHFFGNVNSYGFVCTSFDKIQTIVTISAAYIKNALVFQIRKHFFHRRLFEKIVITSVTSSQITIAVKKILVVKNILPHFGSFHCLQQISGFCIITYPVKISPAFYLQSGYAI